MYGNMLIQSSFRQPPTSRRKGSDVRNIRNSTLPTDRKKGQRDCQTCTRRRIICDRSTPACRKCEIRKIQCPGYDKRLRWDQGVASRGKLKGKAQPVLRSTSVPPPFIQEESQRQLESPSDTLQGPFLRRAHDAFKPLQNRKLQEYETPKGLSSPPQTSMLRQEWWINNRAVSSTLLCSLRRHYEDQVAPKLQWIDAPSNPWRAVLLPLSRSSAALQFAILGFSATHMYVTSMTRTQNSEDICDLPHHLRIRATGSLNTQISHQLSRNCDSSQSKASSIIEIIATMLVLCHIEMLMPGSRDWTLHLRACREICTLERHALPRSSSVEPVMDFFEKALADLEAFESPSSFMLDGHTSDGVLKQPAPRDSFWIFLAVVREVTFTERLRYTRSAQGLTNSEVDMRVWVDKVSRARLLAFSHPSFILDSLQHLRVVFRMVANAHYYAGLVYTHQALAQPADTVDILVRSSVDALFTELRSIAECEWRNFDHDLFWPLFIAGTESVCNGHRQAAIQDYYQSLMASTGFWCNAEGLNFLQDYWIEAGLGVYDNWIHYARSRKSASESFLVY